jgi:alkaline phosphatase
MIGDGMGFHHIDAALANGLDNFVANELPAYGSAITQSQSVINGAANYTDSAAGGTALSSGYKTINGYIGVDSSGKAHKNIRELAHEDGAKTAVVTTDVITGATPAAFLGHNISRDNSQALQSQIDELTKNNGVTYLAASVGNQLQQKTREGLMAIATPNSNFFMMVEEGHIDKFSHSNDTKGMLNCVNRFNEAIAYVIQFVFCHPDTALIISADHETGGLRPDPNNAYKYRYTTGNHTNADVPVYAFGPGTEVFNDKRSDNTELPIFLAKAFGDGKIGKAA